MEPPASPGSRNGADWQLYRILHPPRGRECLSPPSLQLQSIKFYRSRKSHHFWWNCVRVKGVRHGDPGSRARKGKYSPVDDHPENLLALEALLSNLGQNLVRAESGIEALRLLLHHEFALILLDVDMPAINGFETAELIRQRDRSRHTPIIFLTAINKT